MHTPIQHHFCAGMRACTETLHTYYNRPPIKRLIIGVSGGIDSMVMAHLMHHWASEYHIHITAVIIDHKLRIDSTKEAVWTKNYLENMGITAKIMTNQTHKPTTGIQVYARNLRYTLLHQARQDRGADAICVAHHYQDCLETVAIRAEQGSTPYGLSAMNMVHVTPQGIVCRPLLKVQKAHITAYANSHNIAYTNDPSNNNMDFTRVRMRQHMATDTAFYNHLQTTYTESVAFRKRMDTVISNFLSRHTTPIYGAVRLDYTALLSKNPQHSLYILRHLLMWVSGNYTPPRTQKIQTVLRHIQQNRPTTLHGCYIRTLQKNLWIWQESYDIHTRNRFICTHGTIALYGNCPAHLHDKTEQSFVHIPKLVQKNLPVQVYDGCILPLDIKKMQKYDKNALLFTPPPFIL